MSINDKEKIDILLEEYKTLRAELIQRNTTLNQLYLGFGAAFLTIAGIALDKRRVLVAFTLLPILGCLTYLVTRIFDFDVKAASLRIAEIEQQINEKAGADLLKWENEYGLPKIGWGPRIQHIFEPIFSLFSKRSP